MSKTAFYTSLTDELTAIEQAGLYKRERQIASSQSALITLADGSQVINLCANNYLGLANHPDLVQTAKSALDQWGFGMASVRFICGTQSQHQQLEQKLSRFLGTEDTILYSSCFDANGGVFEPLLGEQDAIISDALNHASIIDGVRLCKAQRFRYTNNDMADLENQLKAAQNCRFKLIVTDGVFSMDGIIANLKAVCDLADRYGALVMVDDSHAVGFMGPDGSGTPAFCGVKDRVDIITGTMGKALGGASGGYVSGKKPVIDMLRQRSRPYLFSNSVAPVIVSTTMKVLDMVEKSADLRQKLTDNSHYFRSQMTKAGFTLAGQDHPIIPVMLGDARLAADMAARMLNYGVYVVGFSFPVVPKGQARIRTQMSAAHTRQHLDQAIDGFVQVARELGVLAA